jgi:hypothetical protein
MGSTSYDRLMDQASDIYKVELRRHTNTKAHGPCPRCGGDDRFVVWLFEGVGWCSHCKHSQWFIEIEEGNRDIAEAKAEKLRKQAESRMAMSKCQDWHAYHDSMEDGSLRMLWHQQGVGDEDVYKWGLGYCPSCPTASDYPSLTFPVHYLGTLMDIRHKLLGVPAERIEEVGKYRSHRAYVVPHPFNLDAIASYDDINVVEGEKKPIILARGGFPNTVGIPGATVTSDLLDRVSKMDRKQRIFLMLDPGAESHAANLARQITSMGIETFISDPFIKPDDMLVRYGPAVVRDVIRQSRRVR